MIKVSLYLLYLLHFTTDPSIAAESRNDGAEVRMPKCDTCFNKNFTRKLLADKTRTLDRNLFPLLALLSDQVECLHILITEQEDERNAASVSYENTETYDLKSRTNFTNLSLQNLNTTVNTLFKEFNTINSDIKDFYGKVNNYEKTTDTQVSKKLEEHKEEVNTILDSFKQSMQDNMAKITGKLTEVNSTLQKLCDEHQSTNKHVEREMEYYREVEQQFKDNRKSTEKQFQEIRNQTSLDIRSATEDLNEKLKALTDVTDDLKTNISINSNELQTKMKQYIELKVAGWRESLDTAMLKVRTTIEDDKAVLKTDIERLHAFVDIAKSELAATDQILNQSLQTEITKVVSENKKSSDQLVTLKEKMEISFDETNSKFRQIEEDVEAKLKVHAEAIRKQTEALKTDVENRLSTVESAVTDLKTKVDAKMQKLETTIKQSIVEEIDKMTVQTGEVKQNVTNLKQLVNIIHENTFNKEFFVIAFLILAGLMMINFAIVYCIAKKVSKPPTTQTGLQVPRVSENQGGFQNDAPDSPTEVVNRLSFFSMPQKSRVELLNSVTVISFYEDAQRLHKQLMDSVVGEFPDLALKYHVIRRHSDIHLMPHSKLCIVFVEFSERHVIIEEPNLGLGDLKRKTVEAVYDFGAGLVIVYVKDPGSRKLSRNSLYNDNIYCVTKQPELQELHQNDRFLSIYDRFSKTQKQRLLNIIEAYIDLK